MADPDDPDRLAADDAHILGMESAVSISCAGDVGVGWCTDPGALPDDAVPDRIGASYAALREAAVGHVMIC